MDRQEKRNIRLQICNILKENCSKCTTRQALSLSQHEYEQYCFSNCHVPEELQQLVRLIEGSKQHSGRLNPDEVFYIVHNVPVHGVVKVAKKLNRSEETVRKRFYLENKKTQHHAG